MDNPYRDHFPILKHESPVIYFDNAATTLKPSSVIQAVTKFYTEHTANVSRSHHRNAQLTTELFESVRDKVAMFLNAKSNEIIFTHNCTDSINLLANSLNLSKDDAVVLSTMEHNSAYLPFQARAKVTLFNLDNEGDIDLAVLDSILTAKTRLLVLNHASNVTGNLVNLSEAINLAHLKKIPVLIDASQSVAHTSLNVNLLNCDFLVFSSHKMLGPSGVGILYGKSRYLEQMPAFRTGGGMVKKAGSTNISYQLPPYFFEAGTPNIEGILGFGKALDYFMMHDRDEMHQYLQYLDELFFGELKKRSYIRLLHGRSSFRAPIYTFDFTNKNIDLNYIAGILSDTYNIAVNTGTQCAHLYYEKLELAAGMRTSLYLYNTEAEINLFFSALDELNYMLI